MELKTKCLIGRLVGDFAIGYAAGKFIEKNVHPGERGISKILITLGACGTAMVIADKFDGVYNNCCKEIFGNKLTEVDDAE